MRGLSPSRRWQRQALATLSIAGGLAACSSGQPILDDFEVDPSASEAAYSFAGGQPDGVEADASCEADADCLKPGAQCEWEKGTNWKCCGGGKWHFCLGPSYGCIWSDPCIACSGCGC